MQELMNRVGETGQDSIRPPSIVTRAVSCGRVIPAPTGACAILRRLIGDGPRNMTCAREENHVRG